LTCATITTSTAGIAWFDGDFVARLEGCNRAADLDDSASGLVAQDHRFSNNKLADLAVFPVVHIGSADSSIVDCDQDIVGRRYLWDRQFSEADIVWFIQNK
jgi:hypothetical protein